MTIKDTLKNRVLLMDGAMGTMLQSMNLSEEDFRGEEFRHLRINQLNNYSLLSISQPKIIANIHSKYLQAGADIIETNTFMANALSMKKYGMHKNIFSLNYNSAIIAKNEANKYSSKTKARFVAGCIGPTEFKISENAYSFNDFCDVFHEQIEALIQGGVDLLIFETITNWEVAQAALFAANNYSKSQNMLIPIIISFAFIDNNYNTISSEIIENTIHNLPFIDVISIGYNCGENINKIGESIISLYNGAQYDYYVCPNAGIVNTENHYSITPEIMANNMKNLLKNKSIKIIGGCCGTNPNHIRELAKLIDNKPNI